MPRKCDERADRRIAAGLALAAKLSRSLTGLLHEVAPADPLTYAGVAVVIAFAACAALTVPALRAARVDPMHALRDE